jgi:hypothetical protein
MAARTWFGCSGLTVGGAGMVFALGDGALGEVRCPRSQDGRGLGAVDFDIATNSQGLEVRRFTVRNLSRDASQASVQSPFGGNGLLETRSVRAARLMDGHERSGMRHHVGFAWRRPPF